MANIIERAFDASQRILRAIYKGAPNLFTTSDLNRQFENIDYRMKFLEDSIGIRGDMYWEIDRQTGDLVFWYRHVELHGCALYGTGSDPDWNSLTLSEEAEHPDFESLKLWYTTDIITYEDDPTHEIAGATFVDNSTKPAANQVVIDNWGWSVNDAGIPTGAETITVLSQDDNGNIIQHYVEEGLGFAAYLDAKVTKVSDDLESMLSAAVSNLSRVFTFDGWGSNTDNHYAKLAYCAGVWVFSLRVPAGTIDSTGVIFTGTVSTMPDVLLAKFPTVLLNYVSDTEVTIYAETATGHINLNNACQGHLTFIKTGSGVTFRLYAMSDNTIPVTATYNMRVQTVLPLLG